MNSKLDANSGNMTIWRVEVFQIQCLSYFNQLNPERGANEGQ